MLREWGLEVDVRLDEGSYPTREYRVQYAESDFAFVSRMLEDAGVAYYFEDGTLVLTDAPERRAVSATVPFVHTPTATANALVTELRIQRRVRPGRYTQRDIDHRRVPSFQVVASQAGGTDPEARLERFHYTPGAFLFQTDASEGTPVADDRGTHRADLSRGGELAQRRLDAKRGKARRVTFAARNVNLGAGEVLALSGHPRSDLAEDRPLLITGAMHHGYATGEWHHRYVARFTDVPFRQPIDTPKPRVNGVESAVVVGRVGRRSMSMSSGVCGCIFTGTARARWMSRARVGCPCPTRGVGGLRRHQPAADWAGGESSTFSVATRIGPWWWTRVHRGAAGAVRASREQDAERSQELLVAGHRRLQRADVRGRGGERALAHPGRAQPRESGEKQRERRGAERSLDDDRPPRQPAGGRQPGHRGERPSVCLRRRSGGPHDVRRPHGRLCRWQRAPRGAPEDHDREPEKSSSRWETRCCSCCHTRRCSRATRRTSIRRRFPPASTPFAAT